jgi:hypothetical protein
MNTRNREAAKKLRVEIFDLDTNMWEDHGHVTLTPLADRFHVETVLSSVGVYAPRGADILDWEEKKDRAMIYDGDEFPLARIGYRP